MSLKDELRVTEESLEVTEHMLMRLTLEKENQLYQIKCYKERLDRIPNWIIKLIDLYYDISNNSK